jgi:hypothetical protein
LGSAETTTLSAQVVIIIPERHDTPTATQPASAPATPGDVVATPAPEDVVVTERFDGTTRGLLYTYVEPN